WYFFWFTSCGSLDLRPKIPGPMLQRRPEVWARTLRLDVGRYNAARGRLSCSSYQRAGYSLSFYLPAALPAGLAALRPCGTQVDKKILTATLLSMQVESKGCSISGPRAGGWQELACIARIGRPFANRHRCRARFAI